MPEFAMSTCCAAARQLRGLILLCAWAPVIVFAQNMTPEVITLNYRTAEQVIPALKPLLHKSGTLSGTQNQLIVRTTPANLAELRRVLATLDTVPRRLMVTVRHDAMLDRSQTGIDLSARVDSTRSLDADRDTQSVQVLEGNSAFIRTGQSVPVPQRQGARTIVNGQVFDRFNPAVEYRDVLTGFHVLPRLAGDRVTLEINPQRDTFAMPEQNLPRGSVNVQQAATTVSGRLGEWIEVGSVAQGVPPQQSAILGSTRETSGGNRRILLKVEEIR